MDSTFLGIEIGKRSLLSHRKALNVVSHNLANSNNEAYSRQRIIFQTADPLYRPQLNRTERPGQLGQGVDIAEIRRERDIHLDGRIYDKEGKLAYWDTNASHLNEIENVFNALGEVNLQERLDNFWNSWQNLSVNLSEPAAKTELVQNAKSLTNDIRSKFFKLDNYRREIDEKVNVMVGEINVLSANIAKLNEEIVASKALGDNPNDLLDKRDGLIEELSQLVDVKVNFRDNDEMMVFVGGTIIVQGTKYNQLETASSQRDGLTNVLWERTGERFEPISGKLQAHLEARDEHISKAINQLDVVSNNLLYAVNDIHSQGFNSYGRVTGNFFKIYHPGENVFGNFDSNSDGIQESSLLYEIKGSQVLNPNETVGSDGVITLRKEDKNGNIENIAVNYFSDDKIEDVLTRLNFSEDSLNFSLNNEGRLVVKSRSETPFYPFAIPYLADSGDFLNGISGVLNGPQAVFDSTGINAVDALNPTATFTRTPLKNASAWIDIEDDIVNDTNLVATREGVNYDGINGNESPLGREQGGIALAIAQLRFDKSLFEDKQTFNEYYVNSIADLAGNLKNSQTEQIKYEALLGHLEEIRQSISGVSIDEEMTNMLAYQQGYEAGARVVRVMDELLDTLINRT